MTYVARAIDTLRALTNFDHLYIGGGNAKRVRLDLPPDVTVVGIPARVVRPQLSHRRVVGKIDLDHHLMPDPVGDAIEVLLDRVEFLEARLTHMQKRLRDAGATTAPPHAPSHNLMEVDNG